MRQSVFHGFTRIIVFSNACLISLVAGAANYNAPPEYAVPSGTTIIHAGTLLAVPGESPVSNQSIIVQHGQIVEIRAGRADAAEPF